MLTSQDLRNVFAAFLLLAAGTTIAHADNPPQPDAGDRLSRTLEAWRMRSAEWSTLDVSFTGERRRPSFSVETHFIGRIVLQEGRAVLSIVGQNERTMDAQTDRFVWTRDARHHILPERKEQIVSPIALEEQGRLPAVLALPFLWNTSVEVLKARYRVEFVKEEKTTCLLKITPVTKPGLASFSKAILELDRETYLPGNYVVFGPDGESSTHYRVTKVRCNQSIPEEVFDVPEDDGWKLTRTDQSGFSSLRSRLFKNDMLP